MLTFLKLLLCVCVNISIQYLITNDCSLNMLRHALLRNVWAKKNVKSIKVKHCSLCISLLMPKYPKGGKWNQMKFGLWVNMNKFQLLFLLNILYLFSLSLSASWQMFNFNFLIYLRMFFMLTCSTSIHAWHSYAAHDFFYAGKKLSHIAKVFCVDVWKRDLLFNADFTFQLFSSHFYAYHINWNTQIDGEF